MIIAVSASSRAAPHRVRMLERPEIAATRRPRKLERVRTTRIRTQQLPLPTARGSRFGESDLANARMNGTSQNRIHTTTTKRLQRRIDYSLKQTGIPRYLHLLCYRVTVLLSRLQSLHE